MSKVSLMLGRLYATKDDPLPQNVYVFRPVDISFGDSDEWDMFLCEAVSFQSDTLYKFWRNGRRVGASYKQLDLVREVKSLKFLERKQRRLWKKQAEQWNAVT